MDGWVVLGLTGDRVLVAVTLTDANQEGAIFVLGSEQQLLGLHAVYVPVIPPERHETRRRTQRSQCMNGEYTEKQTERTGLSTRHCVHIHIQRSARSC